MDRIDPARMVEWLHHAATGARDRIALAAREQDVVHRTRAVRDAETLVVRAKNNAEQADRLAGEAQRGLDDTVQQAEDDHAAADEQARLAHTEHDTAAEAAHAITTAAEQELEEGRSAATRAAADWASRVSGWRAGLVHLDGHAVTLPEDPDAIDLRHPFVAVERAHSAAVSSLQRRIADAEAAVAAAEEHVAGISGELASARQQLPVPKAPPWRSPREPERGVPLWAAVAFAEHVTDGQADLVEGALLTAGLLDALITADGLIGDGDLMLTGDHPVAGRSLADLLVPEPGSGANPEQVAALLAAIALDGAGSDLRLGRLRTGALVAAAPHAYRATFIGHSARERARLALVADLEQQLAEAQADLDAARQQVAGLEAAVLAAAAERDAFPPATPIVQAREHVGRLDLALAQARQHTTQALATAATRLTALLADVTAAHAATDRRIEQARQHQQTRAGELQRARQAEAEAEADLTDAGEELAEALAVRDDAQAAQNQCAAEERDFPDLEELRRTAAQEDATTRDAENARATLVEHRRRHQQASDQVRRTLRELNTAATLPDGALLPTDQDTLARHRDLVSTFGRQLDAWNSAGQRTLDLLTAASREHQGAGRIALRYRKAVGDADAAKLEADQLDAQVQQTRELYGAEYAQLRETKETLAGDLTDKQVEDSALEKEFREHDNAAVAAITTLNGIAPRRVEAEQHRTACYDRVGLLVTHQFAVLPDTLARDSDDRPANLTAALAWARQILADKPATTARLDTLKTSRERAQKQLETTMRSVNQALAVFDQQLDSTTLEGTEWRRITLAAPNAAVGEDLRQAAETLRATAEGLEGDLRHDIKATLKTSMFTQLRRDIQTRREAAQDLVRRIRETLTNVRTGVARVGVQVDWKVRDDDNSQQMVTLLGAPPSDEVFDQMYEILRERMEDADDQTWAERVAHTFDYRSWHQWEISVTHSSFGADQFKPVNARSNPLKGLSTGESRLATMLPLLAAAWSMYSGDTYQGPRLLSIDEIDAAFDDKNLRQVLALLRTWNFDVLATTPTLAPLIKREAQHVVIHELVTDGKHRVSVPWLWNGSGEPTPLALTAPADTDER